MSNAVLIMLAILFTVASISAGVTASVSIGFYQIFCEILPSLFFRGVEFFVYFVSQFFTNLLPSEQACGRYTATDNTCI